MNNNNFKFKKRKGILDLSPQEQRSLIFQVSLFILVISCICTVIYNIHNSPIDVTEKTTSYYGVGELEYGENITLKSKDIGECREIDKNQDVTCQAFNSNQHFEPGLYTLIYSPNNYPKITGDEPTLSLNLNLYDYLDFEKSNEGETDYFQVFPNLDESFKIENIPFQEDAYIVFKSIPKDMEFTVGLLRQDQYNLFRNDSKVSGFYPVDIAISQGKYILETEDSNCLKGDKADAHIENYTTNDIFVSHLCDQDEFTLDEGELFVSSNSNIKERWL